MIAGWGVPLGGRDVLPWAVWALIGLEIVVTYSRVPVSELRQMLSHGGIAGGLGRVVVYANYPVSLVAIALVLIAVDARPRARPGGPPGLRSLSAP